MLMLAAFPINRQRILMSGVIACRCFFGWLQVPGKQNEKEGTRLGCRAKGAGQLPFAAG